MNSLDDELGDDLDEDDARNPERHGFVLSVASFVISGLLLAEAIAIETGSSKILAMFEDRGPVSALHRFVLGRPLAISLIVIAVAVASAACGLRSRPLGVRLAAPCLGGLCVLAVPLLVSVGIWTAAF